MKNKTLNIKFLTKRETDQLFHVIDSDSSRYALRNKAIFSLAKYCGLRVSEIGLIKLGDYDPEFHTIFCKRLKNSSSNTLKIVDKSVCKILDLYYSERIATASKIDNLFISQLDKPISRKTLDYYIKKYCEKTTIGCDKRHFHVLKHTRAMELIEYAGVDIRDVQWWIGHENINNTMIYLNYTVAAKATLFNKIEQFEKGE